MALESRHATTRHIPVCTEAVPVHPDTREAWHLQGLLALCQLRFLVNVGVSD